MARKNNIKPFYRVVVSIITDSEEMRLMVTCTLGEWRIEFVILKFKVCTNCKLVTRVCKCLNNFEGVKMAILCWRRI